MVLNTSVTKIILKNWLLQRRSLTGYLTTNRVYRKSKLRVMNGPFKGMQYVENSTGGAYFPKLLGTYEKELYPAIEELATISFDRIINVGAGEGFFTVGLAKRFPAATVVAFEPGFYGCYLAEKMAKMNKVENRITIKAQLCGPSDLNAAVLEQKKNLVFMDVEGAELELLDFNKVPLLKYCAVVVEIHDSVSPELGKTIWNRFSGTHDCVEIWQEERNISDLGFKPALFKNAYVKMMHEGRGSRMRWFVFKPRN